VAAETCLKFYDPEFSVKVQKGDVLVAGKNFGNSSSRLGGQVLVYLGVACVICDSSSRIFFRNTWNIGLPVLECPGITKLVNKGDELEVDILTRAIKNLTTGAVAQAEKPLEHAGCIHRGFVQHTPRLS
jgi:3-isopropylmalate/(R)-2-methylmalate dehydratase small subunit